MLHALLVLAAAVIGVHYLPAVAESYYEFAFALVFLGLSLLFILGTRRYRGNYRLNDPVWTAWLFALVWLGVNALGGPAHRYNLGLLFAFASLVGTWAHPLQSIGVVLAVFASTALGTVNSLWHILPGTPEPVTRLDYAALTTKVFPVLSVGLFQFILLAFKRKPEVPQPKPAEPAQAQSITRRPIQEETAVAVEQGDELVDARQTRFFSRMYLEKQGEQAMVTIKERLDSLVYFMTRLFRAHSAVVFLVNEAKDRLVVKSVVTKSRYFDYQCAIPIGQGVIGEAATKPGGFFTGDLKRYPARLDYYSKREEICSLMATPIMDLGEKRLQGLLLVDSEGMRAFSEEHKELMRRFTQIASDIITSAELTHHMNEAAKRSKSLYEISKKLSTGLKPDEVFDALVQSLTMAFRYDRIMICTLDPRTGMGEIWRVEGDAAGLEPGRRFDIQHPQSVYGTVFRNRQTVLLEGFRKREGFMRLDTEESAGERPQNLLLAPVQDDLKQLWAVVGIESNHSGAYAQPELQLLETIMNTVTSALSKAWMYMEMEKQATVDGLTQIANHRKFQDTLHGELERAKRYEASLTLLLMDIDHFKNFNDTYGHPVGDLVLQMVARALEGSIRSTDFCARYGGEEFVVMLVQADEAQARGLAERIRKAVESMEIRNEDKLLHVTASVGGAVFPHDGAIKRELIDNADKAMYHSKENGRNRVTFYSDLRQARASGGASRAVAGY